jgi:hypothetical protein
MGKMSKRKFASIIAAGLLVAAGIGAYSTWREERLRTWVKSVEAMGITVAIVPVTEVHGKSGPSLYARRAKALMLEGYKCVLQIADEDQAKSFLGDQSECPFPLDLRVSSGVSAEVFQRLRDKYPAAGLERYSGASAFQ